MQVDIEEINGRNSMVKVSDTFWANIYVGFQEGYGSDNVHTIEEVYSLLENFCNKTGFCVSVTETRFIYKNGWESGAVIRLINYPRFPQKEDIIKGKAMEIATTFREKFEQIRLSVEFADETVMVEEITHGTVNGERVKIAIKEK